MLPNKVPQRKHLTGRPAVSLIVVKQGMTYGRYTKASRLSTYNTDESNTQNRRGNNRPEENSPQEIYSRGECLLAAKISTGARTNVCVFAMPTIVGRVGKAGNKDDVTDISWARQCRCAMLRPWRPLFRTEQPRSLLFIQSSCSCFSNAHLRD